MPRDEESSLQKLAGLQSAKLVATYEIPEQLVEAIAARVAELVTAASPEPVSPWLDFTAACAYSASAATPRTIDGPPAPSPAGKRRPGKVCASTATRSTRGCSLGIRDSIGSADRAIVERVSERASQSAVTADAQPLPRRRPVLRHPGIYYRPRRDGKVAPPSKSATSIDREAPLGGRAQQPR